MFNIINTNEYFWSAAIPSSVFITLSSGTTLGETFLKARQPSEYTPAITKITIFRFETKVNKTESNSLNKLLQQGETQIPENETTFLAHIIMLGPVVQKPISVSPGLNF